MSPLLAVSRLRKSYGDHLAVDDVEFSVASGEIFGLLGPNGAGKSTTMMTIAGLLAADSGTIEFKGRRVDASHAAYRSSLGVVPQDLALYPDLTVRENLEFFGRMYNIRGRELKNRTQEVLARIGLRERAGTAVATLSGGMKRRLNFGVSLLHRPRLLILDEPTVGVDPQSRSHLLDSVRELAARGLGVIYASHYMEEVQACCRRVAIMDHGRVLVCDELPRLLKQVHAEVRLHINGTLDGISTLPTVARISHSSETCSEIVVQHNGSTDGTSLDSVMSDVLRKLRDHNVKLVDIRTEEPDLGRLFLEMTGHSLRE